MTVKPDYRASTFDPDVNRAWVVNLGYENQKQFNDDWRDVRAGKLLNPRPNAAVNSLYDPTDAPDGCYTGLLRQMAPYLAAARLCARERCCAKTANDVSTCEKRLRPT